MTNPIWLGVGGFVLLWGAMSPTVLQPSFAKKPVAVLQGDSVRIEFAVDRATDVAVFVENREGEIVRHLAAGCLGSNAPAPLKPNSLVQSLIWDGKDDDGNTVWRTANRPEPLFRVRVGLGLTPAYAGLAFTTNSGPNHIGPVWGMAAGEDGRLYVMDDHSGWLYWPAKALHVFRRDGSYEKTIKPFPSHLAPDRLKGTGAFINQRGYLNPLIHRPLGMTFYAFEDEPAAQMAVSKTGRIYLAVVSAQTPPPGNPTYRGVAAHIAALGTDGSISEPYAGPALGRDIVFQGEVYAGGARMAFSSDGQCLYVVNLGHRYYEQKYKFAPHHVVYRVPLPAMGPAEVFFGERDVNGGDEKHLNNPRGITIDGSGHILVADTGNNRVVVLGEAEGDFRGFFSIETPEWLAVDKTTGAVYVRSADELVKLASWQNPREVARISLKKLTTYRASWGPVTVPLFLALDSSARPPVLWLGRNMGTPSLWRCEDRGESFTDWEPARCFESVLYQRPASDPTHRFVLCGNELLDDKTGNVRKIKIPPGYGNNQGTQSRLDRHCNIYSSSASGGIWKSGSDGKFIPFPATASDPGLKGHLPAGSSGTSAWERDWYVDRKGNIYAKVRGTAYHGLMHVDMFDPDGNKIRTVIWGITDGAYGPRVDARGNIYMMEAIKPAGQPFPEEFVPHVTDRTMRHWYDWIYGSIIKFGPDGGNLWLKVRDPEKNRPLAEPVPLPDSVPKVRVAAFARGDENEIQGALWIVPGVSHVGDMGVTGGGDHCHCTGCDFDVDDFGRVFAPDNGRQRITVLDTAGNVMCHIGAYGNQDYCGPDSYVLDPKGQYFRPRRKDDPPELISPFAKPSIAFNFIIGLAVTDKHLYVADCGNRRMLRIRLGYAVEEVAEIEGKRPWSQ